MLKLRLSERSSTFFIVGAFLFLMLSTVKTDDLKIAHYIDSIVILLQQETELSLLVQSRSNDLSMKRFARRVIRQNRSDIKLLTSWREAYFSGEKMLLDDRQLKLDHLMNINNGRFNNIYIEIMKGQMDKMLLLMKKRVKNEKYDFLQAYLRRNEKVVKKRRKELLKMNDRGLN